MSEERRDDEPRQPFLQRMYDSPFLLLIAGMVVMFIFYTGWGLVEIFTLPRGTLP
jgi:hypothetical protein